MHVYSCHLAIYSHKKREKKKKEKRQVNEKPYGLKRGNIGKEGDKIGMVWHTMYAWCIKIVYVCMGDDDGML